MMVVYTRRQTILRIGFEIQAIGGNPKGAQYAGINVGKTIITTMVLYGAFAALAGATYYLGYYSSIQPRVLPSMGYGYLAIEALIFGN